MNSLKLPQDKLLIIDETVTSSKKKDIKAKTKLRILSIFMNLTFISPLINYFRLNILQQFRKLYFCNVKSGSLRWFLYSHKQIYGVCRH